MAEARPNRWLIVGGTNAGETGTETGRISKRGVVKVMLRLDETHWPQRCVHKRLEDLQKVPGATK